jgi:hypothetical protein
MKTNYLLKPLTVSMAIALSGAAFAQATSIQSLEAVIVTAKPYLVARLSLT